MGFRKKLAGLKPKESIALRATKNSVVSVKRSPNLEHYPCEMSGTAQWTMAANEDIKNVKAHPRDSHLAFQRTIMQAIQLPTRYWEVLVLCDVQGNHPSEAAAILGIRAETAVKRLDKARKFISSFQTPGNA